jgi:hypothetical protein
MAVFRVLLSFVLTAGLIAIPALAQQSIQEPPPAVSDLLRRAERGDIAAQISLGSMYIQGGMVPRNYEEAAKWFRKAAERGHRIAQSLLGSLYAEGSGVPKDPVEAYMWFTLSLSMGESTGTEDPFLKQTTSLRDSLARRMTPEQIEESLKRAKEWKPLSRGTPMAMDAAALAFKLIRRVEPVYPELAKRARVSGRVNLAVMVDGAGNVTDIRVTSGHPLLDDAAVTAVWQWKFSPTLVNGEPVPVTSTVTVLFNFR